MRLLYLFRPVWRHMPGRQQAGRVSNEARQCCEFVDGWMNMQLHPGLTSLLLHAVLAVWGKWIATAAATAAGAPKDGCLASAADQTEPAGPSNDGHQCATTCWDLSTLSTNSRHPLARPSLLLLLLGPQPATRLHLVELHVAAILRTPRRLHSRSAALLRSSNVAYMMSD